MTKLQMQLKKKQKEAKAAAGKGTKQSADGKKKMAADQAAIQCKICLQTFPSTSKQPALQVHIDAKHSKTKSTFADCFPSLAGAGAS